MLTKIYIDITNELNWELEEKLFNMSNGFEVENQSLILWVAQDVENVLLLLNEANISFQLHRFN